MFRYLRCLLLFCLLGLCFYAGIAGYRRIFDISQALADPSRFAGVSVELPYIRVKTILPGELQIEREGVRLSVQIPGRRGAESHPMIEQIRAGDYVSLRGVFRAPGYLALQDIHVHKGRQLKILVSLFGLVILAALLIDERKGSPGDDDA